MLKKLIICAIMAVATSQIWAPPGAKPTKEQEDAINAGKKRIGACVNNCHMRYPKNIEDRARCQNACH